MNTHLCLQQVPGFGQYRHLVTEACVLLELHHWDETRNCEKVLQLEQLSKQTHTTKFNDIAADFSSLLKVENTFKQKPAEVQSEPRTEHRWTVW